MACMYYVNYKVDEDKLYKKIYNKIFYKYEIISFEEDKKIININKPFINKRFEKKIDKHCTLDSNLDDYVLLVSNDIKLEDNKNNYKSLSGKILMKYMIIDLIECLENAVEADFRNEEIYLLVNSDRYTEIIEECAKKFRCVNIVTDKIKKLRRLENKLNKDEEILFSISNNRKKALKRCKILINIDFKGEQFEEFSINRDCIIINLNESCLKLKNSFHGTVLENIEISYNNRYKDYIDDKKFDKTKLYESYIISKDYKTAKEYIVEDNCNINVLKGVNSNINRNELKNNFAKSSIKLDKKRKKD